MQRKNVFQKIADLVKHVFEKIKSYIDDTPMTKAARLAAELNVEQKEKIQQMFMDAVDKAGGELQRNWIVIIRVKKKRKEGSIRSR